MGCELLKLVQLVIDGVNDEMGATYQYGGAFRANRRDAHARLQKLIGSSF